MFRFRNRLYGVEFLITLPEILNNFCITIAELLKQMMEWKEKYLCMMPKEANEIIIVQ